MTSLTQQPMAVHKDCLAYCVLEARHLRLGTTSQASLDTAQYPAGPTAPPAPDYGQTRTVQIGRGPSAYSLPIFGNPPAQDPAAIPPNAQPAVGQLPQATLQATPQMQGADPSLGDRLQAGLNGFIGNAHTGPIGAILGGIERPLMVSHLQQK